MRAKTTLGHEVFALQRWVNPSTKSPEWSGKIRLVKDDPEYDDFFDWHREAYRNGVAIGHDMGDLTGELY